MLYASQVWGQKDNIHVNKIIKLQKKAMRIITFSNFRAHCSPLFKSKQILKFTDQIKLDNCLFVHAFFNKKLPKSFTQFFKTLNSTYPNNLITRNSSKGVLYVPTTRTVTHGSNSFKIRAACSWNYFINVFNSEPSLYILSTSHLKNKIKSHHLGMY